MHITRLETFVIGDGPDIDPDKGGIEPLACIRLHTDGGLVGLSEVFRVPPGVVQATVGGPETHFGRLLIGQEITHPERLWQHLWDALIHTNRRGWEIIILGALDVAAWDIYFFETPFPVDVPETYAKLAAKTSIPLAMGEHGVTRWEFLDMLDRGQVTVVQPYMTTCGGLTEARRIVELTLPRGGLVCPGNWSTQILGAASVHLAAYSPITPFLEFAPAEVFESPLRQALQDAGFPVRNGVISLPTRPGIGYQLPEEIVRRFGI